jgi:two-component system, OmpR family, phosphate regulon sensor histidine kinase PhoR
MRLRVHHPLFVGLLAVVGLLVSSIVLFIGSGLREELGTNFRGELERQLDLADALVTSGTLLDPDSLATLITSRVGYRTTLIGLDGVVLADSYVDQGRLPEVENHLDRPEVQQVLGGASVAFAERASATVSQSLLYGARLTVLAGSPAVLRLAAPQTDIDRAVGRLQRTVAFTGLVAALLALAAVYALSMVFTRPLVALAERAGRLAEGDFTSKVPLGRVAEMQDLAMAFNRLTDELQARVSELRHERDEMETLIDCMAEGVIALDRDAGLVRMNRAARAVLDLRDVPAPSHIGTLIRDAALRNALVASVEKEAQSLEVEIGGHHLLLASRALDHGGAVTTLLDITELKHLEQVRRDFVANASHELKTPLTSIRGYAETLAEDDPPEHLRIQFLNSIHNNTLRLQHLVDDLLDLSRLESGGWAAARDEVTVGSTVSEAWNLMASRPDESMDFSVNGDAVVVGDREGLVQVFRNLLENSVRHTGPSGNISVAIVVNEGDGVAEISVRDDGEGIPGSSLPRVFERFYRADSSRARDFGGTGLGLAIVKHLVNAMGGEVSAQSELGKGTTIRFTLPLS